VDSASADFLLRLQESGFGVWVAESVWAYPIILTLHTVGLALLVGTTAFVDLRVLGVGSGVPVAPLDRLSPARWTGLGINAATGVALFVSAAAEKGAQPIFYIKLGLIALALIVDSRLRRRVFRQHEDVGLAGAKGFAAMSLCLWAAAITAGRLMAYA
jgi:hypothetical protein